MNPAMRDDVAIAFSLGFYDALGVGKSIEKAFEIGRASVMLAIQQKTPDKERKLVPDFEENEPSSEVSMPILKKKKILQTPRPDETNPIGNR